MTFRRPVPTIGDATSAAERAQAPDAWAMRDDVDALERVVGARRDIRRFRPDRVPDDVLIAVLTAGHRGPSVGHSQPWRFVVVTEAATRDAAAHLADRSRLRQAAAMADESARGLLDLRLEGIREAPLGIVVACDRRAPAAGVLGRATFPDADLWSCAAAIENIWLTARAHGLGLGWVDALRADRARRSPGAARRRRDARLALPRLARRTSARARSRAGRLVAPPAARRGGHA